MAQSNRLVYDEPVDIETIAKRIADLNQQVPRSTGRGSAPSESHS